MFAQIVQGKADIADFLFLVAFVIFLGCAAYALWKKVDKFACACCIGVAVLSLAFFVS